MTYLYNNSGSIFTWICILGAALYLFLSIVKVIDQNERGVVLTLGRYTATLQPGLRLLVPFVQKIRLADIRVVTMEIQPQDVITKDNVSVKVAAVAYYKIVDAEKALLGVEDVNAAILQLAQIKLRSTIGQHKLDQVLSEQTMLNQMISAAIETNATNWGVDIDHVEIRNVDLDPSMVRAMAQEAEAERGRRARVITAEGEFEAAAKLSEAADILAKNPAALTLRTLATMKEIGAERNTMILFPVAQESLLPSMTPAAALGAAAMAKQHATT